MIDSYALLNKRLYLGASIHTALRSLSKFFCPFGGKPSLPFSFLHSTAYAITMVCTLCNICFSAHSKFKSQFSCSNKWPMKHTQISLQRKKHTGALCHRRPVLSTTHLSPSSVSGMYPCSSLSPSLALITSSSPTLAQEALCEPVHCAHTLEHYADPITEDCH